MRGPWVDVTVMTCPRGAPLTGYVVIAPASEGVPWVDKGRVPAPGVLSSRARATGVVSAAQQKGIDVHQNSEQAARMPLQVIQ